MITLWRILTGFLSQCCLTNYVPLKTHRLQNGISDSVQMPNGHLPSEKVSNSRKDHREERTDYGIHAIGDKDVLVGHIPIEIYIYIYFDCDHGSSLEPKAYIINICKRVENISFSLV